MTVLLVWLAMSQAVTPELRAQVEAGMQAKANGDLDSAIRAFRRVTELAPDMAAAHANLGAALFEKRDYDGAEGPLRRALALNPALVGSAQMLGTALLVQGAAEEAVPYLEKSGADHLLGIALLEAGRPREALEKLEAALAGKPGDPDLLYYAAQAHGRLARLVYDRLRTNPAAEARVQQMMAEAQAASGNREASAKHFQAALAARPDLRGVHLSLGELYLAAADYGRAETEFRAEVVLSPKSAAAAYRLGAALAQNGKAVEAVAALERALLLAPAMPETLLELGKVHAAAGNAQAAEPPLLRVIEIEPQSALAEAAHLQLAAIYRKLGRAADAESQTKALRDLRAKRARGY